MRIHLILVCLVLVGCGSVTVRKSEPDAATANGSCLRPDPTVAGKNICHETSEVTLGSAFCTGTGGRWSASKCDVAQYARRCRSISQMSVNDGPARDIEEFDFVAAGSTMVCPGEETPTAAGATTEPSSVEESDVSDGDQQKSDAELRRALGSLPKPVAVLDKDVTWGGVLKKGENFYGPTFEFDGAGATQIKLSLVSLATTTACYRTIAMGFYYESGYGTADLAKSHTHYIQNGHIKGSSFTSLGLPPRGEPTKFSLQGGVIPEVPSVRDCPFLATFRLSIDKSQ